MSIFLLVQNVYTHGALYGVYVVYTQILLLLSVYVIIHIHVIYIAYKVYIDIAYLYILTGVKLLLWLAEGYDSISFFRSSARALTYLK